MPTNELNPCPFCGESGDRNVQIQSNGWAIYSVRCLSCSARGPSGDYEGVVELWNGRTDSASSAGAILDTLETQDG